jgi:hypothetical protein
MISTKLSAVNALIHCPKELSLCRPDLHGFLLLTEYRLAACGRQTANASSERLIWLKHATLGERRVWPSLPVARAEAAAAVVGSDDGT